MLNSVKIENFRSFQSFELQQLGRINLLVGENNSGKTSILEAVQLLCSRNNLESLYEMMSNRSEYLLDDNYTSNTELDIRHLFYGHKIEPGSKFSIIGAGKTQEQLVVSIEVHKTHPTESSIQFNILPSEEIPDALKEIDFTIQWDSGKDQYFRIPLSISGGLPLEYIRRYRRDKNLTIRTQYVTSLSLSTEKMIELFHQIVLTSEEKIVEDALKKIDPKIQRIATVSPPKFRDLSVARGGFLVLLADSEQRVPIASMGDGIWRILGLALATACAKDGYLFIDEIDTGLHFTTMSDMWRMIWETAKRLNVQVFATTHNNDCWQSLADIAEQNDATDDGIRIHRIEKGKVKSIVFTEPQIVIAAEREIEVR